MKTKQKEENLLKNIFTVANKSNAETKDLESVKSGNLENETLVNLGVKIPAAHRNYWNSKAKLQGLSMKSIIIESLIEKLGNPE
jgi:hypothetical protein